jgi:hypothetical protein
VKILCWGWRQWWRRPLQKSSMLYCTELSLHLQRFSVLEWKSWISRVLLWPLRDLPISFLGSVLVVLLGNNKCTILYQSKISLELCPKENLLIIACLICRSEHIRNRFGIHTVEPICISHKCILCRMLQGTGMS